MERVLNCKSLIKYVCRACTIRYYSLQTSRAYSQKVLSTQNSPSSVAVEEEQLQSPFSHINVSLETDVKLSRQGSKHPEWIEPVGYNTGIMVYNSLTKQKNKLILSKGRLATWYMCGPTVYDSAHLGHASAYIRFDILRRVLTSFFNIDVVLVCGVTDIDDKIIAKARELNMEYLQIARQYEMEFNRDMAALKVLPPHVSTRVTEHVPEIIKYIQKIIDNGYAYPTESGNVYFDIEKYGRYGKLWTHTSETQARDSENKEKRNPRDFALWKAYKPGEPWWQSPWGSKKGRPGWHIECSTMASIMFGERLDLHSGGIDLLFPHHENELAQSQAHYCCSQWTNYWLHCGHLHLKDDAEKMSKSLKNYITVSKMLENYTANQFRIFCLLSHYRSKMEYSEEHMQKAVSVQKQLANFLEVSDCYMRGKMDLHPIDEPLLWQSLDETKKKFYEALADDFDTPKALNELLKLVKLANIQLSRHSTKQDVARSPGVIAAILSYVDRILDLLGIQFSGRQTMFESESDHTLSQVLDSVVSFRSKVRLNALTKGKHASPQKKKAKTDDDAKSEVLAEEPDRLERDTLLKYCDEFRDDLVLCGVQLKDRGKESAWQILEDKSLQGKMSSFGSSHPKYGSS